MYFRLSFKKTIFNVKYLVILRDTSNESAVLSSHFTRCTSGLTGIQTSFNRFIHTDLCTRKTDKSLKGTF